METSFYIQSINFYEEKDQFLSITVNEKLPFSLEN
jgi:hypothetical protein